MLKITEVKPCEDYRLEIRLDNGKHGIFDVRPFLDKGIFKELKNLEYFKLVMSRGRSIFWPNEQDFSADTINELMEA